MIGTPTLGLNADELMAEAVARGFVTAAVAAEAGHPVTEEGRRDRRIRWESSADPDIRAAFEAGRLTGLDEYDRALARALTFALGGPQAKSVRDGADRHEKAIKCRERRAAFDRGDPDVLAEHAREAAADRERQAERDRRSLEVGLACKPIGGGNPGSAEYLAGWREMRRGLTDREWESVWVNGLNDQTRLRLADLAPSGQVLPVVRTIRQRDWRRAA